ncbi:MAG: hypothetical protein JWN41_1322 [Thermoleophilia bacterium]|nr:hypothetical protein [Thermoleophilia bacterium]
MQLTTYLPPNAPAESTYLGTIAVPQQGLAPLPMVAAQQEGPTAGWASLADAVRAVQLLTAPRDVPAFAVMEHDGRFIARRMLFDIYASHGHTGGGAQAVWRGWNLEWSTNRYGAPALDFTGGDPELRALVDNGEVRMRA